MSLGLGTRGLTKSYGRFNAVAEVDLDLKPGLIHAVLGENGAGKSTLMKMLFGLVKPTAGKILIQGKPISFANSMDAIRAGIGMVQQHFTLVENLSAIDNIMLGAEVRGAWGQIDRTKAIELLNSRIPNEKLAVPWMSLVNELTVGQRQRVEILKLLFRDAQVLFLDEPTAVLTPQEVEEFFAILRSLRAAGRTIVLVTHKIHEVKNLCDDFFILRQGRLTGQGEVRDFTTEQIVEMMIGRKLQNLDEMRSPASSDLLLRSHEVREKLRSRGSLRGLNLQVHSREIVGVAGVDGSGQGHFVEAILGLRPFDGELEVLGISTANTRAIREGGLGLIPEDRLAQGLWPQASCTVNAMIGLEEKFAHYGLFQKEKMVSTTLAWAKSFDVRMTSMDIPAGSLSGGNQQKLIFAREVSGRSPKLLVCHQPTRGVDLGAIELIHKKLLELRNSGLGVLLISSELEELMTLCDRIYVFFEGSVCGEIPRSDFDRLKIGQLMLNGKESS